MYLFTLVLFVRYIYLLSLGIARLGLLVDRQCGSGQPRACSFFIWPVHSFLIPGSAPR